MIESAVSSAVSAPRSSPIGAEIRCQLGLVDALGHQPLAAALLRAAGAHRADVGGLGAQRDDQRRVVELRVVREDGDRGRAVDAAEALERLLRPCRDDLLGVREALRLGEARAGIDDERAPAGRAGEPAQRGREVDGAEDEQPRRRERDVDEQRRVALLAALGPLDPHQLVGVAGGGVLEHLVAERALAWSPSGSDEQLGARGGPDQHRDEGAPPARAGELGERRRSRSRLVALHVDLDLAAARQPDVPRLLVGDPEVQQLRLPAARAPARRPRRRRPPRSRRRRRRRSRRAR